MKSISRLLYLLVTIIIVIFSFSVIYNTLINKYKNKNSFNNDAIRELPYLDIKNEPSNLDNEESKTIKIYNELNSAVVNITYYRTEYVRYFFDLYPQTSEGQGSGAIIDPRGYIITNYHVIGDADKVTVTLSQDEGTYDAKMEW